MSNCGCCKPTTPTRSACPCSRRNSTASKGRSPTSTSAYRAGREDAKLRLRADLHLATNAHAFYLACDCGRRRLCNQAFFTKTTLTEHLDVTSEFTGVYETILDPTNRLHAEFWQRTGQLHPDIDLAHNEATLPTDHGGRVGTSTQWWYLRYLT